MSDTQDFQQRSSNNKVEEDPYTELMRLLDGGDAETKDSTQYNQKASNLQSSREDFSALEKELEEALMHQSANSSAPSSSTFSSPSSSSFKPAANVSVGSRAIDPAHRDFAAAPLQEKSDFAQANAQPPLGSWASQAAHSETQPKGHESFMASEAPPYGNAQNAAYKENAANMRPPIVDTYDFRNDAVPTADDINAAAYAAQQPYSDMMQQSEPRASLPMDEEIGEMLKMQKLGLSGGGGDSLPPFDNNEEQPWELPGAPPMFPKIRRRNILTPFAIIGLVALLGGTAYYYYAKSNRASVFIYADKKPFKVGLTTENQDSDSDFSIGRDQSSVQDDNAVTQKNLLDNTERPHLSTKQQADHQPEYEDLSSHFAPTGQNKQMAESNQNQADTAAHDNDINNAISQQDEPATVVVPPSEEQTQDKAQAALAQRNARVSENSGSLYTQDRETNAKNQQAQKNDSEAAINAPFYVQIASSPNKSLMEKKRRDFLPRYGRVLQGQALVIQKANLGERGIFYRLRVPMENYDDAQDLHEQLKGLGIDSYVGRY